MDRVSKLEKLFNTIPLEGVPEQYQKWALYLTIRQLALVVYEQ